MNRFLFTGALVIMQVLTLTGLPVFADSESAPARVLKDLRGHTGWTKALVISSDGKLGLSGSEDRNAILWDLETGVAVRQLLGHKDTVNAVAFAPNGQLAATGGSDKTLILWSIPEGKVLRRFDGVFSNMVIDTRFSPDGTMVFASDFAGKIVAWRVADGTKYLEFDTGRSKPKLAVSPNSQRLAIGTADGTVTVKDIVTDAQVCQFQSHSEAISVLAFSDDGNQLASGGNDAVISLNEVQSGRQLHSFHADDWVLGLRFVNNSRQLLSAGLDRKARLWNLQSGAQESEVPITGGWAVAFDCGGKRMLRGNDNKEIALWELNLVKDMPVASTTGEKTRTTLLQTSATTQPPTAESVSRPAPPAGELRNANRPVKDKWALVIGISEFANPAYNLKYAAKDAQDFSNFLINEAGFKRDHVRLLLNSQATRRNVVSSFGSKFLPNVTDPDDLVVVYVSTHGTPSHRDQAGNNYIATYDTEADDPYTTGVNMDEVYDAIKKRVKSDRALIVMDTCYSGGAVPGARSLKEGDNFDVEKITLGSGQIVLSSSGLGERSWESKNYANGVFTKNLLDVLRANGTRFDLKSVFPKLQDAVKWEVKRDFGMAQTPQVGGRWEGQDLVLSVKPTAPRDAGGSAFDGLIPGKKVVEDPIKVGPHGAPQKNSSLETKNGLKK